MTTLATLRQTALRAVIALALATTVTAEAASPTPLSAVTSSLADHYAGSARSSSPAEREKLRAELEFYSAAISASMTLTDALTSLRLYGDNHGILNMAGLGNSAEVRLDSAHPFENEKRIQACNREIIEANTALQAAYRSFNARFPNSALVREFQGISTYLADGALRATASPAKPAFAVGINLGDKVSAAIYSATSSGQGNELYQRVKKAAFLLHLYGLDSFKNPAPSAELSMHEATRDLTKEKAASCLPPVYTQGMRSANLRTYFQVREELAAKLEKL